jgi:hypothetical protein
MSLQVPEFVFVCGPLCSRNAAATVRPCVSKKAKALGRSIKIRRACLIACGESHIAWAANQLEGEDQEVPVRTPDTLLHRWSTASPRSVREKTPRFGWLG